jgi:hypothetical protein
MRLWELFSDVQASRAAMKRDIERVEDRLNRTVYAPQDKIKARKPVLDLELPTGSPARPAHFYQRAWERKIKPSEIEDVLRQGKDDFSDELDAAAKKTDSRDTFDYYDPMTHVHVPIMVVPNPRCVKSQEGNPVCLTRDGKLEPKNELVAKTIIRKGSPDDREWNMESRNHKWSDEDIPFLKESIKEQFDIANPRFDELPGYSYYYDSRLVEYMVSEIFSDDEMNSWLKDRIPNEPVKNPTYRVRIAARGDSRPNALKFAVILTPTDRYIAGEHSEDHPGKTNTGMFFFQTEKEAKDFITLFRLQFSNKYDIDVKM